MTGIGNSLNGSDGPTRLGVFGRNTLQYPRTQVLDLRLSKRFQFFERYNLELLGESFNLANHQNVTALQTTAYSIGTTTGVGNTLTFNTTGSGANVSPLYQVVTNTNSAGFAYTPRQLQLSARFQF